MRENHRQDIVTRFGDRSGNSLKLLEQLYWQPIVTVHHVAEITGLTYANANNLVAKLVTLGILKETTEQKRNRRFAYSPYLAFFTD